MISKGGIMADAATKGGSMTTTLIALSKDKTFPFEKLAVEIQLMVLKEYLIFPDPLEVFGVAQRSLCAPLCSLLQIKVLNIALYKTQSQFYLRRYLRYFRKPQ